MLRFSRRLPIGKFFAYSSALIAVLAVVLAGKGVAALQEAGLLDIQPLAGVPRIDLLGIHPTVEGVAGQLLVLALVLAGFWYSRHPAPVPSAQAGAAWRLCCRRGISGRPAMATGTVSLRLLGIPSQPHREEDLTCNHPATPHASLSTATRWMSAQPCGPMRPPSSPLSRPSTSVARRI